MPTLCFNLGKPKVIKEAKLLSTSLNVKYWKGSMACGIIAHILFFCFHTNEKVYGQRESELISMNLSF